MAPTRKLNPTETALLEKYASQVLAFREFCIKHGNDRAFEESDFKDLAVGFFIALGVDGDIDGSGELFADAFWLSSICRYALQYWNGQTL